MCFTRELKCWAAADTSVRTCSFAHFTWISSCSFDIQFLINCSQQTTTELSRGNECYRRFPREFWAGKLPSSFFWDYTSFSRKFVYWIFQKTGNIFEALLVIASADERWNRSVFLDFLESPVYSKMFNYCLCSWIFKKDVEKGKQQRAIVEIVQSSLMNNQCDVSHIFSF